MARKSRDGRKWLERSTFSRTGRDGGLAGSPLSSAFLGRHRLDKVARGLVVAAVTASSVCASAKSQWHVSVQEGWQVATTADGTPVSEETHPAQMSLHVSEVTGCFTLLEASATLV